MLTYVNLTAVLGTALFMVAASTLWYSEYLFLKLWMRSVQLTQEQIDRASVHLVRNAVITFFLYVIGVYVVALFVGYAQVFNVSVQHVALALASICVALTAGFALWEQRSLTYIAITAGFVSVFVLGSAFILYYWPW